MVLFYSRDLNQAPKLAEYCKRNSIELVAQSMISFEEVHFEIPDKNFDVVFFTSPRSVDFFLAKSEITRNQKMACIGTQTKSHIEQLGLQVDFWGEDSTQPDEVAQAFRLWLGERRVLLPVSNKSNRTVPKALNADQYEELVVYKTVEKPSKIDENIAVLIFSSPSNASAFLHANTITTHQIVACFGRTTQQFLQDKQIDAQIISAPKEAAVLEFLATIQKN